MSCAVEGCGLGGPITRGFCNRHYRRFMRYGDPTTTVVAVDPPEICSVDGCGRSYAARGFCDRHYRRWRRGGSPDYDGRQAKVRPPIERFMQKVQIAPSGCWEWMASKSASGYATFSGMQASRFIYEHHVGPIPDGHQVDHLCFNPGCVNPEHLEAVTVVENNHRRRIISGIQ